ncbi:hypothetical protein C8J57DRAFT_1520568 [Mycena rebaudengoi]|nr:hypothetical protein C8J57DRAFT_1520568 [Mycena rebaudengoi]
MDITIRWISQPPECTSRRIFNHHRPGFLGWFLVHVSLLVALRKRENHPDDIRIEPGVLWPLTAETTHTIIPPPAATSPREKTTTRDCRHIIVDSGEHRAFDVAWFAYFGASRRRWKRSVAP